MSTNNNVFSVLPTAGDQDVLSGGETLAGLKIGQLGFFDAQTNLAINGIASGSFGRTFYFALGIGDGAPGDPSTDIVKSAGSNIQYQNITSYSGVCPSDGQPMIVDVSGFQASCDTEYGLKIEFENAQIGKNYGFNQFTKTFIIQTACCEECVDCPSGDCNDLAERMVAEINNDEDGVVTAEYSVYKGILTVTNGSTAGETSTFTITYSDGTTQVVSVVSAAADTIATVTDLIAAAFNTASGVSATSDGVDTVDIFGAKAGTVVFATGGDVAVTVTQEILVEAITVADYPTFKVENPTVCPSIRLISEPAAIGNYCNINLKYYASRETFLTVSTIEGFDCGVVVTTNQELTYDQGLGYDLKQLEYTAGGWKGKPGPYRVGELVGTDFGNFQSLAVSTTYYIQFNLGYDQYSVGGWQEYRNNLSTVIAIPCGDDTTFAKVDAILNKIGDQIRVPGVGAAGPVPGDCDAKNCPL